MSRRYKTFLLIGCLACCYWAHVLVMSISGHLGLAVAKTMSGKEMDVKGDFDNDKAGLNLSGVACGGSDGKLRWCLAVNDEKFYAQFFSIKNGRIHPGERIRLSDSARGYENDEIDAEAVAYSKGFFYIVGSHGRGRNTHRYSPSSYLIFRFPVNQVTGKPEFEFDKDDVSDEIEVSSRLGPVIETAPIIGKFGCNKLKNNGVNIEGLAVVDDHLYLGFRGPSVAGHAFVLQASIDEVFDADHDGDLRIAVHRLKLGKKTGIRGMTAVRGGMLVLSGPVNDQKIPYRVSFWRQNTGTLEQLAELDPKHDGKAESIMVIGTTTTKKSVVYDALIMFDGEEDGRPTRITLKRQP